MSFNLNVDRFWQWLSYDGGLDNIGYYIRKIEEWVQHPEYLLCFDEDEQSVSDSEPMIMDNLARLMPRRYFLEIQFCAKVYATIFGRLFPPLVKQVEQLAYVEWLLYVEPGYMRYRDHLVHMFKVAYICHQLLSDTDLRCHVYSKQFESEHFKEWCKERSIDHRGWDDKKKAQIVEIALFVSALFHDYGYGYYFLQKYKNRLFSINQWIYPGIDQVTPNSEFGKQILKSLPATFICNNHNLLSESKNKNTKHANQNSIIIGFFRDCLPLNHSVASAFNIINLTEKLRNGGMLADELYVAFQLAAEATLFHDMTKDNNWLHLSKNANGHFLIPQNHDQTPLSLILIFADELSVWQRCRLEAELNEDGHSVSYCLQANKTSEISVEFQTSNCPSITITGSDKNEMKEIQDAFNDINCFQSEQEETMLFDYKLHVIFNN